jgi:hypothetical protein
MEYIMMRKFINKENLLENINILIFKPNINFLIINFYKD